MIRFPRQLIAAVALGFAAPALAQSIDVKDATGATKTIRAPNPNGRAAAAASAPVVLSSEDKAVLDAHTAALIQLHTDMIAATPAGSNTIGSIGNTAFGISGTLPAFATTPTVNLGTLNGAATAANQATTNTALGTLALESGGNLAAAKADLDTLVARYPTGNTAPMQSSGGSVALAAGEAHAGEVGGRTILVAASVSTPAGTTAYAANQLVANSAAAGSVTPLDFATACRVNGGSGMVRRARIKTTDTGFASAALYLYLYRDAPTVSNGDRGTWLTTEANYVGAIPVTLDKHFTDFEKGIGAPLTASEINFDCASGSQHLYGLLVTAAAVSAPVGAKTFTAVLETLAN